jgi:hypothetical protein
MNGASGARETALQVLISMRDRRTRGRMPR